MGECKQVLSASLFNSIWNPLTFTFNPQYVLHAVMRLIPWFTCIQLDLHVYIYITNCHISNNSIWPTKTWTPWKCLHKMSVKIWENREKNSSKSEYFFYSGPNKFLFFSMSCAPLWLLKMALLCCFSINSACCTFSWKSI